MMCDCGQPVFIKKTGECRKCYNAKYYKSYERKPSEPKPKKQPRNHCVLEDGTVIYVSVSKTCNKCKATNHSDHNKHLAHKKKWRDANRTIEYARKSARGYNDVRNGRIKSTHKLIKTKEWIRLSKANCAYCGQPGGEVDHIIPLARGGTHSIGNLTSSCRRCNSSKGMKLLIEWKRDANR
jgi:5-methylcytosine-specific restriction endonuclease McrA